MLRGLDLLANLRDTAGQPENLLLWHFLMNLTAWLSCLWTISIVQSAADWTIVWAKISLKPLGEMGERMHHSVQGTWDVVTLEGSGQLHGQYSSPYGKREQTETVPLIVNILVMVQKKFGAKRKQVNTEVRKPCLFSNRCLPTCRDRVQLHRVADLFWPLRSLRAVCWPDWMWTGIGQHGMGLPGTPEPGADGKY